jgi:hypothetical protein
VANSSSVQPWTLQMPQGSLQQWTFTLTTVDGFTGQSEPWSITGNTWEYVARVSGTDDGTPLIEITTSASAAGLITVTGSASLSQVLLAIYPAATQPLSPGTYYHALWANPGTATALALFTGPLIIAGTPQP